MTQHLPMYVFPKVFVSYKCFVLVLFLIFFQPDISKTSVYPKRNNVCETLRHCSLLCMYLRTSCAFLQNSNWPFDPERGSWWRARWSCQWESPLWCCLLTLPCSPPPASVEDTIHVDRMWHLTLFFFFLSRLSWELSGPLYFCFWSRFKIIFSVPCSFL